MTCALILASGCDPSAPGVEAPFASANASTAGAVSTADSRFNATVTIAFDATVTSSSPMYDAVTGQTTTQMVLDTPPSSFAVQAGYTTAGVFTYTQTAFDPAGNPVTESVDDVREVQVRNGVFGLKAASGAPAAGMADAPAPTLQQVFSASGTEPLVILDGLVLTSFPQVGTTMQRGTNDTEAATVNSVTQSGGVTTVSTTVASSDPAIPALPQQRDYVQRGTEHVLSEVRTDVASQTPGVSVTGRMTIRFENVVYVRNAQKDQARRNGTAPSAWSGLGGTVTTNETPAPCNPQEQECDPVSSPPGGGSTGCPTTAGGANLVYVHGIQSYGAAWGDPAQGTSLPGGVAGPVNCALRIGDILKPSLTQGGNNGTGRHTEQAAQLLSETNTWGSNLVFVGHSQGGLISRRVAQANVTRGTASRIRAVVTTGTPHQGAVLANTLNPSPHFGTTLGAVASRVACRITLCSGISTPLTLLRDDFLALAFTSPAMADLRPSSNAIRDVNIPTETFPRFGITNSVPKRWAVARLAGDYTSANNGESVANFVKRLYHVSVAASVIGIFIPNIVSAGAVYVAHTLNQTDRWWTRITVGNSEGDGVVTLSS